MRWREYPVLPDGDARFEAFRTGLDDDAARVLAYLVGRRESDNVESNEATRLELRVGTGLGRDATIEALTTLETRDLVRCTTVARDSRGRPPKGWTTAADRETLSTRIRSHHSYRLCERADEVARRLGATPPSDWLDDVEPTVPASDTTAELTVVLNWVPNGLHAPLIAATDFAERNGVEITLESARGSGSALKQLRTGSADIAVVGAASFCRDAEESFVPLALLFQRSMAVLYTTTERLGEPFTTVEQLRGRRLAVSPDSEVSRLARLFLAQSRLLDDVEIVAVAGEEREALVDGDAAVATGMPIDVRELAAAGYDVSSLAVADHFPVPGPALVTTAAKLRREPATVLRFLMGTVAGATAARTHPERTARRVADRSDDDVASERWRIERVRDQSVGERGWGWQTLAAWERLEAALRSEATG
ncbi:ABC-type nitrate/sulfonate/bicarbonate transport system, substrate-binding protein [Halogranum amylolyticum]|uniref:ABC-type nitrate/sulfonate/bicarbonate transport system, substrate-binding protein n=1 Tax=Halogranum amylolyticum TaxID=660520 RepID=A0A1H8TIF5_9EURY|nr:ABC transporter substrate-binding protein [Halogranum amylolyticum]SEO90657.1 ABC-type nitrate/sulfonate/bicarbonate transport system, substrate-binding protein [Halogranum amylolyticum]